MESLLARLRELVGAARVVTAEPDMAPFAGDWRGRYRGTPLAVVLPADTTEVSAVVAACHAAAVAMVPQGGNTGLCGGATPRGGEVVINLSRLNRIRAVDAANDTLVAEAGCTLHAVREAAAQAGRLFPLELASQGSCEIGGNLATNAGGVHVLRYGNMRDLVLGLEVVLPDGTVWEGLRGLRKDNTGYDLKHLFIGAEGTLGIITAAVLRLFPRPARQATAWVGLASVGQAMDLLGRVKARAQQRLDSFELIGRPALELVLAHIPGAVDPLPAAYPWYALIELADADPAADPAALLTDLLGESLEAGVLADATVAVSVARSRALWALRENVSEAQRIEGYSIKHDVSVPVSRVATFIDRATAGIAEGWPGARVVAFGHAGDGNIHYNLSMPEAAANTRLLAQTAAINRHVHDLVHSLGGSISAEHGLGQLKREEILRYKSPVEMQLMRSIKAALDPHGLMNPGKVL